MLNAYTQLHLEEEIRREAMVKDWPAFVRFLRFAAVESGQMINYTKSPRKWGISVPTMKGHYQLLEDMFVGIRVPAYSGSPRKNLLSTDRIYIFRSRHPPRRRRIGSGNRYCDGQSRSGL